MLISNRVAVESELRMVGKGQNPPPHVVLDKLFDIGEIDNKIELLPE